MSVETPLGTALPPPAPGAAETLRIPSLRLLGLLFFLSGASSLVFETLFSRLLTYTFGNTAHAVSTVLAAFLGGLALGAFLIGRAVDRMRPSILIYGVLELAIGCYGVVVPWLFAGLTHAYVFLHGTLHLPPAGLASIRFFLAALVIVIPSALMGGTLPVLARMVAATRSAYHADTDWLYALNTFGASAGVLLTTYFLMPTWGVPGAIAVASLLNALIFLYTFWFSRSKSPAAAGQPDSPGRAAAAESLDFRAGNSPEPAGTESGLPRSAARLVLFAAFLTGLITLSYEVVWTHALAFLVGNAVYSFGTMLFTFLCGLAAGAHFVSQFPRTVSSWKRLFAGSQILAGFAVLLTLPLWNRVPGLFLVGVKGTLPVDIMALAALVLARQAYLVVKSAVRRQAKPWFAAHGKEFAAEAAALAFLFWLWTQSSAAAFSAGQGLWRAPATYFAATEMFRFLICFFLLIVPAFLMGMAFPVLLNLLNADRQKAGKHVGTVYAANTLGSILGSLLTGFLLLEALGSYATLWLASLLNILLGLVFFAVLVPMKPQRKLALLCAGAAALAIFALRPSNWSVKDLTTGTYVYFMRQWPVDKVVYAHEDVQGGLTTVVRSGNTNTLLTNGKFQGNNTAEIQAQARFALVPMLFTHEFERALVIGLGTGNSLKALSTFPFRRLDVAEFAPGIVEAARSWFSDVNGGVIDQDPRVHLLVADGRNHLLLSKDRYDLITIEVSSIWISGEADIYNREFYELCRSHLASQGILQQWVQVHHMRPRDFQVILATAARVFPHVSFFLGPEQGLLVASSSPLRVDYQQIVGFDHTPAVRQELDIIRRHSLFSVLGEMALYDESYRGLVRDLAQSGGHPADTVSTDAFPYLEYQTPKGNVLPLKYLLDPQVILERRPASPASAIELSNVREPTDRDYVDGLALVHRGELEASIAAFRRVQGSNRGCAQEEIAWIEGIRRRIQDRTQPLPPAPSTSCP